MVSLNNINGLLKEDRPVYRSAFGNIGCAKVENNIVQFYDVIRDNDGVTRNYPKESCVYVPGDTFGSAAKRAGYCLS